MENDQPVINVAGDTAALGPLCRDLLPLYYRWGNDFQTARTTASSRPTALDEFTRSYDEVIASSQNAFSPV